MVPENIHTPNTESVEIPRRRGLLKAKSFEGKYEPKLEFPVGWGVQNQKKKTSMGVGGVWLFFGATH